MAQWLCIWLVCLAIWTSARATNDTAKCIAIFWCLYALIANGFERSIANMTIFAIALFAEHPATVIWGGMGRNLRWASLDNIVGVGHWAASREPTAAAAQIMLAAAE